MPTIVMVKPRDQVKHVPVNAANVEIENDTCVFMPTAGALINSMMSDDRCAWVLETVCIAAYCCVVYLLMHFILFIC